MAWVSNDPSEQLGVRIATLRDGTLFEIGTRRNKVVRFLGCTGDPTFQGYYDDAQDREDVTVNLINAIYALPST